LREEGRAGKSRDEKRGEGRRRALRSIPPVPNLALHHCMGMFDQPVM